MEKFIRDVSHTHQRSAWDDQHSMDRSFGRFHRYLEKRCVITLPSTIAHAVLSLADLRVQFQIKVQTQGVWETSVFLRCQTCRRSCQTQHEADGWVISRSYIEHIPPRINWLCPDGGVSGKACGIWWMGGWPVLVCGENGGGIF